MASQHRQTPTKVKHRGSSLGGGRGHRSVSHCKASHLTIQNTRAWIIRTRLATTTTPFLGQAKPGTNPGQGTMDVSQTTSTEILTRQRKTNRYVLAKRRTHPDALCPLDTSTGQVSENTRESTSLTTRCYRMENNKRIAFQSDYFSSSLTRTVADAARGQTAWTGDSQCSQPSMYSNDQRLLYDAHETRDPVNMPYWASMVEPGFG